MLVKGVLAYRDLPKPLASSILFWNLSCAFRVNIIHGTKSYQYIYRGEITSVVPIFSKRICLRFIHSSCPVVPYMHHLKLGKYYHSLYRAKWSYDDFAEPSMHAQEIPHCFLYPHYRKHLVITHQLSTNSTSGLAKWLISNMKHPQQT